MLREIGGVKCFCNTHRKTYMVEEGEWKGYQASECACGNIIYLEEVQEDILDAVRSRRKAPKRNVSKQSDSLLGTGSMWDNSSSYRDKEQEEVNRIAAKYQPVRKRLMQILGRAPLIEEIATEMGVDVKKIKYVHEETEMLEKHMASQHRNRVVAA